MTAVVFYFQVHQPYRLRSYAHAQVGTDHEYFDDPENKRIVERVAARCYLPMNKIIAEQIEATDGEFRCAFSLSGTVIQQLRDWVPEALDSFVALAETGNVEFLCETSHHSLASQVGLRRVGDPVAAEEAQEFEHQVRNHREVIKE